MAQSGYTHIQLYNSTTPAAAPSAGNLAAGELAINITDGKLFYKDNGGSVQVLATKAGANGDVVGPGSSTDNALVRFDTTTGKLVQNSVGILSDTGALSGLTDISASGSVTLSGGTANGVAYLNGSKVLTTGSALTFDGSSLGIGVAASAKLDVYGGSGGIVYVRGTGDAYQEIAGGGRTPGTGSLLVGQGNAGEGYLWNRFNSYLSFGVNSTEQMRLTSTGLGIGTSSPAAKLDVSSTTDGDTVRVSFPVGSTGANGGAIQFRAYTNSPNLVEQSRIQSICTDGSASFGAALRFMTAGGGTLAERMRLDSAGNLGIGTSSPAYKLDVSGVGRATTLFTNGSTSGTNGGSAVLVQNEGTSVIGIGNYSNMIGGAFDNTATIFAAAALRFTSGGTTTATIDSSGNLGLGVTPSAWMSAFKAIELQAGALSGISTDEIELSQNVFYSVSPSSWSYKNTAAASQYRQVSGQHTWLTAPSGTAGSPLSFNQVMTLDASGNLAIGSTYTPYRLGLQVQESATNVGALEVTNGINTSFEVHLRTGVTTVNAGGVGTLVFATGSSVTERARIDSSGNLIQSVPSSPPSLTTNGQMVFNLTSNTNLRVSVRGSDGVTRTANITLS